MTSVGGDISIVAILVIRVTFSFGEQTESHQLQLESHSGFAETSPVTPSLSFIVLHAHGVENKESGPLFFGNRDWQITNIKFLKVNIRSIQYDRFEITISTVCNCQF